jgi:2-oxoglutarate dehydrogenase E1 component
MDRFSFLNAAHKFFGTIIRSIFKEVSVEPSWKFFQGFDFGMTTYNEENPVEQIAILQLLMQMLVYFG